MTTPLPLFPYCDVCQLRLAREKCGTWDVCRRCHAARRITRHCQHLTFEEARRIYAKRARAPASCFGCGDQRRACACA